MSQLVGVFGQDGSEVADKLIAMWETLHSQDVVKANFQASKPWLVSSSFEYESLIPHVRHKVHQCGPL